VFTSTAPARSTNQASVLGLPPIAVTNCRHQKIAVTKNKQLPSPIAVTKKLPSPKINKTKTTAS